MNADAIEQKKHAVIVQLTELYAGTNLRLQRDALKTIEERVGRFLEMLDEELTQKAD